MDLNLVIPTTPNPNISEFRQGDRITVTVKVREGERERLQAFEGDVIRKRGRGLGSTFTVRRVSHGIAVERTFPYYSPSVESVKLVSHQKSRQARPYYLRSLYGKAARLKEDRRRSRR